MVRERVIGIWYATAAFTLWGFLPLYWKALRHVPSSQIISHRVVWSWLTVTSLLILQKRMEEARKMLRPTRNKLLFILNAFCLGINWLIYIWAVNAGYVVETSMGYFINPIINVILGIIFFRERLIFWQMVSVLLAFIGVSYMTMQYGKLPWIALSLAFTFGFYGLLRKKSEADSLIGLTFETAILSPFATLYIVLRGIQGTGVFASGSFSTHVLLIGSGGVTTAALLWFVHGARRIPLSTVGFLQYIAPSIQLFIGTIIFKETFTIVHAVSFSFIWTALFIYSISQTPFMRRLVPPKFNKIFSGGE
jgi:chloramphenicol-sensitive protein RarD